MARAFKALVAGGIVGTVAWAVREHLAAQEAAGVARVIPATTTAPKPPSRARTAVQGLFGSLLDDLLDGDLPTGRQTPTAPRTSAPAAPERASSGSFRPSGATGDVGALLAIIRKHESRGDYNAVWNRISAADRPRGGVSRMTIGEVLDWQDSIDRKYNSEAAGAYQILEDTLRGLYRSAGLTKDHRFDRTNQDKLAIALLNRRGLQRYRQGKITDRDFAQQLAMEWASFPAQTRDKRGRAATGQSYYAGDGLNASLTSKSAVLAAVRKI